jgi:hypothetical protein
MPPRCVNSRGRDTRGKAPQVQKHSNTSDAPAAYAVRFNREDMILEVACGSHVAATFALTEPRKAEDEAHRLNYEMAAAWPVVIRNGMVSRRKAVA